MLKRWLRSATSPYVKREDRQIGKYGGEMLGLVKRHHVRISTDTLLFWKALEALDTTAIRLSGHFDPLDSMRAFFERTRRSRASRISQMLAERNVWWRRVALAAAAFEPGNWIGSLLRSERRARWRETEGGDTKRCGDRRTQWACAAVLSLTAILLVAQDGGAVPMLALSGAASLMIAAMAFPGIRRRR